MPKIVNLLKQKFGLLKVLRRAAKDQQGRWRWLCLCKCGNKVEVKSNNLRTGNSTSCGCQKSKIKHGLSGSRTYQSWSHMLDRVKHKRHESYVNVQVDPRWFDFSNFLKDMGLRPDGTTLDRRNTWKGYNKANCGWVDRKEQTRNRKTAVYVRWNRRKVRLSDLAESEGVVSLTVVRSRLKLGWDLKKALKTPKLAQ